MKAFKSLSAHKYFKSGFTSELGCKIFGEKYLVVGNVKHSQKINEPPLKAWFIADEDGSIDCGHCTCMAGVGEVCSHVGALLFAVDFITQNKCNKSCTDVRSLWNVPKVTKVDYKPIKEIHFGQIFSGSRPETAGVVPFSEDRIKSLLKKIQDSGSSSALQRVVEPFCSQIAKGRESAIPTNPYTELYNNNFETFDYDELIIIASRLEILITSEEAECILKHTNLQSASPEWYLQRAGRITASNFNAVCRTSIEQPSITTIKSICYPTKVCFKTNATEWGKNHEKTALEAYRLNAHPFHDNLEITDTGFNILSQYPYLGASPDAIVQCHCCGKGCIEIKCPYVLKNLTIIEFAEKKQTCLINSEDGVFLDKSHMYYYQVQMQMAITETEYCDFVVWAPTEFYVERIAFNETFWQVKLATAEAFHKQVILPELLGKYFTKGSSQLHWYICNGIDDGRPMVECCNENCEIRWFHMECVGLSTLPDSLWFCNQCHNI